jgi:hypothetical protein
MNNPDNTSALPSSSSFENVLKILMIIVISTGFIQYKKFAFSLSRKEAGKKSTICQKECKSPKKKHSIYNFLKIW